MSPGPEDRDLPGAPGEDLGQPQLSGSALGELGPEARSAQRAGLESLAAQLYPASGPAGGAGSSGLNWARLLLLAFGAILLAALALRGAGNRAPQVPTSAPLASPQAATDGVGAPGPGGRLPDTSGQPSGNPAGDIGAPRVQDSLPTAVVPGGAAGLSASDAPSRSGPASALQARSGGGSTPGAAATEQAPAIGQPGRDSPVAGVPGPGALAGGEGEVASLRDLVVETWPCPGVDGGRAGDIVTAPSVVGRVVDAYCRPVAERVLLFRGEGRDLEYLSRSDLDGSFSVTLESGSYAVELLESGAWRAWQDGRLADDLGRVPRVVIGAGGAPARLDIMLVEGVRP